MIFFPTADEDFQYFRSQGYTGSLNDMHYKAMGDLGYTGSLNDRIHAYLISEYGSFYEAMRDLRNGTSVFSLLSAYAVNGFDPSLVFDFKGNYFRKSATDSTFGASITHARASSATMMNASGTLVTVGNNVPRTGHHQYNGSAWVNEGILHESEARTNILVYSSDYTGANWTKNGTTATASAGVSPSGLTDASLITATAITDEHRFYQNRPSAGTHNTFYNKGIYAKAGTANFISISGGSLASGYAVFNLSTGVVSSQANMQQAAIEDVGSGWYRCSMHGTVTSNFLVVNIGTTAANAVPETNWLGAGETVQVYGSQWEAGSTPSSYIPTGSASATRAAETLTVPAANLPYSSTNMSIQMDGKMNYADRNLIREVQFVEWLADSNNGIEQFACSEVAGFFPRGAVAFFQEAAATTDIRITPAQTLPFGTNVPFNISSRHGSTFLNGSVGGVALTADTTPTALPDLSSTNLLLADTFMGTIKQFRMWSDDLGDVGIAEAST